MRTILLIEDDPFLIDIYGTKLKEAGFKVEIATDGEEGLTKLKEKIPDVLLLDIVLPKIDGWEVLKKIKEIKEMSEKASGHEKNKFNNLKMVVLSNLGQKEDVERGLKLGATKYLIKAHYTPSEIVKEIKNLFK